jgi:hypothetical protein
MVMKTKILSVMFILMATVLTGYAESPQSALQKTISSNVKFPPAAIEKQIEGTVYAEFMVKENGKVEVLNCFSLQGELQSYIYDLLSSTTVSPHPDIRGKTFSMEFEFQLEKI